MMETNFMKKFIGILGLLISAAMIPTKAQIPPQKIEQAIALNSLGTVQLKFIRIMSPLITISVQPMCI
jgi:hypothetical protein